MCSSRTTQDTPAPETADSSSREHAGYARTRNRRCVPVDTPAYQVGDTVYLDGRPFEITGIAQLNIQLRDPAPYPIFRSEAEKALRG